MTKEEIIEMACQAFAGIIKKEERDNFINFAKLVAEKSEQEQDEPMAWIFEDELPKNYPYEEMFPYSKIDVVRMFPIFGPSSKKEQASSNNEVLLQYPKENVEWQKQQMEHAQQLKAEALKQEQGEPKCKTHPDAPHGFVRNASHSEDRYVCECEFWEPPEQDKPNLFWNDDEPERSYSSIDELLNDEWCNCDLKAGDTRTVQQAIRLPNVVVRVISVSEDGDINYTIEAKLKEKNT